MKPGYVLGLGHSEHLVGSSSSMLFVHLAQRLEEARLKIKEMRARQKEYGARFQAGKNEEDDSRAARAKGGAVVKTTT